ncbi:MAG: hypothetical protein PHC51_13135 [bacterium]|nr:hypothetical protein [bacterium]
MISQKQLLSQEDIGSISVKTAKTTRLLAELPWQYLAAYNSYDKYLWVLNSRTTHRL